MPNQDHEAHVTSVKGSFTCEAWGGCWEYVSRFNSSGSLTLSNLLVPRTPGLQLAGASLLMEATSHRSPSAREEGSLGTATPHLMQPQRDGLTHCDVPPVLGGDTIRAFGKCQSHMGTAQRAGRVSAPRPGNCTIR